MFISSCFEVRDKLIWPFLEYWINVMIYINVAIVPWFVLGVVNSNHKCQPSHLSSVAFIRIKSSLRWHKIMNYGCLRENYHWSIQVKTSLATDDIFSPLEAYLVENSFSIQYIKGYVNIRCAANLHFIHLHLFFHQT